MRAIALSMMLTSIGQSLRTPMRIGDVVRPIELSLVPRRGMLCRMLIGRRALAGVFRVDPGRTYVLTPARRPAPETDA